MTIDPKQFTETAKETKKFLTKQGWQVTDYGAEYMSEDTQQALQSKYNLTNLYVRTRPDLIAVRDGFNETFLIECKDLTDQGKSTGNLAIEAVPWFFSRHLHKMGIRLLYAVKTEEKGIFLFKSDEYPFTTFTKIFLPNLHEDFFRKKVLSKLKKVFPNDQFYLRQIKTKEDSSSDPFILVPIETIKNYGHSIERFAKWGWKLMTIRKKHHSEKTISKLHQIL